MPSTPHASMLALVLLLFAPHGGTSGSASTSGANGPVPPPPPPAHDPQERSRDEAAVHAALEHYLTGHATGEGASFARVFHDDAMLWWSADGTLRTRTSRDYIAGAAGRPAADEGERHRRIAWVEVTGDVAVARIDLDYPAAAITDYMSLVRVDGAWRIVNKIFHVGPPGADDDDHTDAVERPSAEDARASIAATGRAFSAAYVAGDTAAIREIYTEDARLLPPDGEVRGRDAIAAYFAPRTGRRNLAHQMVAEDLRIGDGSATEAGTWTHTVQAEGQSPSTASGRYLIVWRRDRDGRWRIEYDMWHRPAGD